jgi:hypothetical protein
MFTALLPILAAAVLFVLYLALASVLIRKYKSTGDVGFLWLGVAIILWPIASNVIVGWSGHALMQHALSNHHSAKPNGLSKSGAAFASDVSALLDLLQRAVELVLVMFAVRFLYKSADKTVVSKALK